MDKNILSLETKREDPSALSFISEISALENHGRSFGRVNYVKYPLLTFEETLISRLHCLFNL